MKTIDELIKEVEKVLNHKPRIDSDKYHYYLGQFAAFTRAKSQHDKEIAELKSEIRKLVADQNEIQLKTREEYKKEQEELYNGLHEY